MRAVRPQVSPPHTCVYSAESVTLALPSLPRAASFPRVLPEATSLKRRGCLENRVETLQHLRAYDAAWDTHSQSFYSKLQPLPRPPGKGSPGPRQTARVSPTTALPSQHPLPGAAPGALSGMATFLPGRRLRCAHTKRTKRATLGSARQVGVAGAGPGPTRSLAGGAPAPPLPVLAPPSRSAAAPRPPRVLGIPPAEPCARGAGCAPAAWETCGSLPAEEGGSRAKAGATAAPGNGPRPSRGPKTRNRSTADTSVQV